MLFNQQQLRNEFPALHQSVNGKPLVYFDNAATNQKPKAVIDRIVQYYEKENANIHRGVHYLSQMATEAYEETRQYLQMFLNAAHSHEIIFTRGTTESINLVASSFGKKFLKPGDEVLITEMEHHSNIVPWQMVCEEKGATLKAIPISPEGELELGSLETLITDKTKILALAHVSNALGTINPIKEIIDIAHKHGIPVLIDGAQAVSHLKVDVQDLDCDFYCLSGHKIYGPMGIGVLYGKEKWLEQLPPYQGGGEMIKQVSIQKTTYADLPFKFEAGTPNVGDAMGLEAAIRFVSYMRLDSIEASECYLLEYATQKLLELGNVRIIGTAKNKASVLSFLLKDIHPYDTGVLLDKMGIAVRTGHHCAQPVMDKLGIPGTVRASFAVYNTTQEIDLMVEALKKITQMFS